MVAGPIPRGGGGSDPGNGSPQPPSRLLQCMTDLECSVGRSERPPPPPPPTPNKSWLWGGWKMEKRVGNREILVSLVYFGLRQPLAFGEIPGGGGKHENTISRR